MGGWIDIFGGEQGFEIVEGIKNERGKEKRLHGLGAKLFYSVISRMAGFDMVVAATNIDNE